MREVAVMRSTPFLLLALLVTLTACNTVHSDKPLFGPEDALDAPPLRPGLWLQDDANSECRVNTARSVRKWPACVGWMLVRETDVASYGQTKQGGEWASFPFILARGQTRIFQVTSHPGKVDGETTRAKGAEQDDIQYLGLTPKALDAEGRIIAYRSWNAQCGPQDETQYPNDSGVHPTTLAPLPGLTMTEDGLACMAHDQQAVRGSVEASRDWDTELQEAHWVRDPRPDDFAKPR